MLRLRQYNSDEINGVLIFDLMAEVESPFSYEIWAKMDSNGRLVVKATKCEFGQTIISSENIEV